MSVLMSESFINLLNRFIQTADSFRKELAVLMNGPLNQLTHSIHLNVDGLAWNLQDVRWNGRSPIRAGHVRNWPIPITGRSIGASLAQP